VSHTRTKIELDTRLGSGTRRIRDESSRGQEIKESSKFRRTVKQKRTNHPKQ